MNDIAPTLDHAPKRSILVVDDMEANRAVLCRRLERFGYAVDSVDSGASALARIAVALPDMVLLDYMMPQMNGIEVLQHLRGDLRTRDLPVIMVTARAESGATIEALGAGADDYVTKPIDFDVLRARIETHIDKRTSADDLRRANAALDERVVMRSMALADLEQELADEIKRRRDLERTLYDRPEGQGATSQADASKSDLAAKLGTIVERYEQIFNNVTAGRAPNFAQMANLRLLLDVLKRDFAE
ncbi:response regulator [Novosphingobium sp. SL115]|uniref:response regulator n=1 Tax=Novosphingobium sp. SL115 TaxID=2995150 RepID=UPI002275CCDF|nr:response regulator [Novosphingobium sp. SL115]MCY1669419.1 response regulator [Novosphingobium sp. SL115]